MKIIFMYSLLLINQDRRGYYSENDVINLHNFINSELKKINAHIDEFFYSPYHPTMRINFYII